jgi:hypothetical protein
MALRYIAKRLSGKAGIFDRLAMLAQDSHHYRMLSVARKELSETRGVNL